MNAATMVITRANTWDLVGCRIGQRQRTYLALSIAALVMTTVVVVVTDALGGNANYRYMGYIANALAIVAFCTIMIRNHGAKAAQSFRAHDVAAALRLQAYLRLGIADSGDNSSDHDNELRQAQLNIENRANDLLPLVVALDVPTDSSASPLVNSGEASTYLADADKVGVDVQSNYKYEGKYCRRAAARYQFATNVLRSLVAVLCVSIVLFAEVPFVQPFSGGFDPGGNLHLIVLSIAILCMVASIWCQDIAVWNLERARRKETAAEILFDKLRGAEERVSASTSELKNRQSINVWKTIVALELGLWPLTAQRKPH